MTKPDYDKAYVLQCNEETGSLRKISRKTKSAFNYFFHWFEWFFSRTISVSSFTNEEITNLIETLELMLNGNVVVVEGLNNDQIKSVRDHLAKSMENRNQTAVVLKHTITTEWLEEVMSKFNRVPEVIVFKQLADIFRRLNDLESIGEKVLTKGVVSFRPSGQIVFGR